MADIYLTDKDDDFTDTNQGNRIFARAGNDVIRPRGGDDTVLAGVGNDFIFIGDGRDTLRGGAGNDAFDFYGDEFGADAPVEVSVYGGDGRDRMGFGNRLVDPEKIGSIFFDGGSGDDSVFLPAFGGGTFIGGAGDDNFNVSTLEGGGIRASGGDGFDRITARGHGTNVTGGDDADRIDVSAFREGSVDGGSGNDYIDFYAGDSGRARGGTGNDIMFVGGGFIDVLDVSGGAGDDRIKLEEGDFLRLSGNSGKDIVDASNGSQDASILLIGGAGKDIAVGGDGDDTFAFNNGDVGRGTSRDIIRAFERADDTIDVSGIDANIGRAGDQAFSFVGETRNVSAGKLGFYQAGDDTIVAFNNGSNIFQVELDQLDVNLRASDLLL